MIKYLALVWSMFALGPGSSHAHPVGARYLAAQPRITVTTKTEAAKRLGAHQAELQQALAAIMRGPPS